jgi:23S rRNA (cytosine1962-C5)-methyltransferase
MQEIELPLLLDGEDLSPLKSRLRKQYRHIRKWAKRTQTNCFRIYDRHIPQYPLAIDFYAGRFLVQYFSPRKEEDPPSWLYEETLHALRSLFGVEDRSIYWRSRIQREKTQQYEKRDASRDFFVVYEYGVPFWVNLVDYLDTGLFLDHRETRRWVAANSKGKRVLNLFAYTCSFSVHAAVAGAAYTKSVDLSNTYTEWGRRNFLLNALPSETNEILREDCLRFLEFEMRSKALYDLIVIDPPTLSRSKKMEQMFDVQLDYISLILKALELLTEDGILLFSTNSRKFRFDEAQFPRCSIWNVSDKTIPLDFRDPKIHHCWKIKRASSSLGQSKAENLRERPSG